MRKDLAARQAEMRVRYGATPLERAEKRLEQQRLEQRAERDRTRRERRERLRKGVCPTCGGIRSVSRTYCSKCIEKARLYVRKLSSEREATSQVGRPRKRAVGVVYFAQALNGGPIKIGYTRYVYIQKRLNELQTGNPYPIRLIGVIENAEKDVEQKLHNDFIHLRMCGEWFQPADELLRYIDQNASNPEVTDIVDISPSFVSDYQHRSEQ